MFPVALSRQYGTPESSQRNLAKWYIELMGNPSERKEKFPALTLERATEKDIDAYQEVQLSAAGSPLYSPTIDREGLLAYLRILCV